MRDIKLRFWDKENKSMVYQDNKCLYPFNIYKIICDSFTNFELRLFILKDNNLNQFEEVDSVKMQYTEVKDSNGKKIYEGDIVKIEDYFGEDMICKVIYDETEACYWLMKGDERNHFKMTFDLESYVHTVIGNIYENKDLLEGNR